MPKQASQSGFFSTSLIPTLLRGNAYLRLYWQLSAFPPWTVGTSKHMM